MPETLILGPGGLDRAPKEEAPIVGIKMIKSASLPQFAFEWHPMAKAVYVLFLDHPDTVSGKRKVGQLIYPGCTSEQTFVVVAECFCRGYRQRQREIGERPALVVDEKEFKSGFSEI